MKKLAKSLALIGFQACGKTTLGRLLAEKLKCSFEDTDRLIEQFHPGLTCRDIFQHFGSDYFRHLESLAIASLKYQLPMVLATGGGSLHLVENREKLKAHCTLIYLKTRPDILKERIWQRKHLPAYLKSADPHQDFVQVYQERVSVYEAWADYTLEMDHLEIQDAIWQLMLIAGATI